MSETHFRGRVAQKALIVKDSKVLITRDSDDEVFELPGGRLDNGEMPKDGILREIQEELGAEAIVKNVLDIQSMHHKRDDEEMLVVYYELELVDEEVKFTPDKKEVAEMVWVDAVSYSSYEYFPEYKAALDYYFNKTT